jgi:hypothetical protein
MQEVMVELLCYINGLENEEQKFSKEEIPENIYKIADTIMKRVCKRRGLKEQDYTEVMHKYRNSKDNDVSGRAKETDKLVEEIKKGEMPREVLVCDSRYTKELTINICRWIALSDAYVDYKKVVAATHETGSITKKQFEELKELTAGKKAKRCSEILEQKIKFPGYGKNDYFNIVKKPYCKYRIEDKDFDNNARELQALCDKLDEMISSELAIVEFRNDPLNLSLEEVQEFYNKMYSKYTKIDPNTLSPMSKGNDSGIDVNDSPLIPKKDRNLIMLDKSLKEDEEIKSAGIEKSSSFEEIKGNTEVSKEPEDEYFEEFHSSDEEYARRNEDNGRGDQGKSEVKEDMNTLTNSQAEELFDSNAKSTISADTKNEEEG